MQIDVSLLHSIASPRLAPNHLVYFPLHSLTLGVEKLQLVLYAILCQSHASRPISSGGSVELVMDAVERRRYSDVAPWPSEAARPGTITDVSLRTGYQLHIMRTSVKQSPTFLTRYGGVEVSWSRPRVRRYLEHQWSKKAAACRTE